ncbi:hypothetical protein DF050_36180 [Burkholderia cepacia]|nr:hypothetical protein DF050_36180 [Burkholderia cepacia]
MSKLVRGAPGVVFSSDVLGVEWVRKVRPSAGGDPLPENEQRSERRERPKVIWLTPFKRAMQSRCLCSNESEPTLSPTSSGPSGRSPGK